MSSFFLTTGFILLTIISYTQIDFTGEYTGIVNGDNTTIRLVQKIDQITGEYVEPAGTYQIHGTASQNKINGKLLVMNTTELATFTGVLHGANLDLDLLLVGVSKLKANFVKKGTGSTVTGIAAAIDKKERDPNIIGNWIKEEVINSGFGGNAASLVTVYYLRFNADGTFVQEKSGSAGGSAWSQVGSRVVDAQGHWYTQNNVMYLKVQGQADYVMLNKYLFHETNLVFKSPDGKYQIWGKN